MLTDSTIRPVRDSDRASLVSIWERSVRATHHFLTGADIEHLRPLAAEELHNGSIDLWVLVNAGDVPLGFIGIASDRIAKRGGARLLPEPRVQRDRPFGPR